MTIEMYVVGYIALALGLFIGFLMGIDTQTDPEELPLPRPEVERAPEPTRLPRSEVFWPYQSRN